MIKQCHLAIFTKVPEMGKVKTRMQPDYPLDFSYELHTQLVKHCLTLCRSLSCLPISIWLSGDTKHFRHIFTEASCFTLYSQVGKNLGERMQYATEYLLEKHQSVLLIGSDCPFLDAPYLELAIQKLQTNDVVIGPAIDGGYVLIGLKAKSPTVFKDIDWGTEQVHEQTINIINNNGANVYQLDTLADIDRPGDIPLLRSLPGFRALLERWLK